MLLGYNTNGFAHHRLEDALAILAQIGYQSVAITVDYNALNPYADRIPRQRQLDAVRRILTDQGLRSVIETGARFLLDPWHKHQPTLISPDNTQRDTRLEFLCRAVDVAQHLGSDAVSFWSGAPEDYAAFSVHLDRLVEACRRLCDYAASRDVRLAFEPEPGMLIDSMARFEELLDRVGHPSFGLTIDLGHLHCQGETPIAGHLRRWRHLLWNIHIEDMRRGVHEHLMFGNGEMDFEPILWTLREIGYHGGLHVELSRHSADAVETARRSFAFLHSIMSAERYVSGPPLI
jgi:sugar phosphate isomerase/epimerase